MNLAACPLAVEASSQARQGPGGLRDCPDFDRLCGFYRWMELATFGPWLQWCRCAWIHRLSGCRRALVLGDGDGRFTARLLQANPVVTLEAVDASLAMLMALLRRAGPNADRVTVHAADARLWQIAGQPYDLVVTHFFLDCITTEEVRAMAKMVRAAVCDDAVWVVSEFAIPEGRYGRLVASPLVAVLYRAFGWLTGLAVRSLPEYANALGEAGFTLKERRTWLGGLLTSEVWSPSRRNEP